MIPLESLLRFEHFQKMHHSCDVLSKKKGREELEDFYGPINFAMNFIIDPSAVRCLNGLNSAWCQLQIQGSRCAIILGRLLKLVKLSYQSNLYPKDPTHDPILDEFLQASMIMHCNVAQEANTCLEFILWNSGKKALKKNVQRVLDTKNSVL